MSISLKEAYEGKKQDIKFSTSEKCITCKGNGSKPGHSPDKCSYCGGNGKVRSNQGFFTVQQTCPQCNGNGEEITNPCSDCCLLYTSPSPRDLSTSRMPSSA